MGGFQLVHRYGTRRAKKGHVNFWRFILIFWFISLWYFQQKSTILRGVSVCPKAAVFRLADFCWRSWYKVLLASHYVLQWLRYLETSLLKSSNDKSMSARYASYIEATWSSVILSTARGSRCCVWKWLSEVRRLDSSSVAIQILLVEQELPTFRGTWVHHRFLVGFVLLDLQFYMYAL